MEIILGVSCTGLGAAIVALIESQTYTYEYYYFNNYEHENEYPRHYTRFIYLPNDGEGMWCGPLVS